MYCHAEVFKLMPLAAVVAETTLVLHGGLWRKPPEKKRKAGAGGRRGPAKCAKHSRKGDGQSSSGDPEWMSSLEPGSGKIRLGTLKCEPQLLPLLHVPLLSCAMFVVAVTALNIERR